MHHWVTVPFTTAAVRLVAVPADPAATVRVDGANVPPGAASPPLALALWDNTFGIAVTANDGFTAFLTEVPFRPPACAASAVPSWRHPENPGWPALTRGWVGPSRERTRTHVQRTSAPKLTVPACEGRQAAGLGLKRLRD